MKLKPIATVVPVHTVTESNTHGHWWAKSKRAKQHRTLAAQLLGAPVARIRIGLRTGTLGARVLVTMVRVSPRELDDDNLASALKHVRDGIADALGVDDRDPRVAWRCEQARGEERAVRVTIEVAS